MILQARRNFEAVKQGSMMERDAALEVPGQRHPAVLDPFPDASMPKLIR